MICMKFSLPEVLIIATASAVAVMVDTILAVVGSAATVWVGLSACEWWQKRHAHETAPHTRR